MAAVEHQHRRARALVLALRDHQVFVVDGDARCARRDVEAMRDAADARCGRASRRLASRLARRTAFMIVAARVEVHRVAELVRLRRAAGLDAGGHLARVVAAEAALAERAEQVAQRAVAEEVEALVGDLEAVLLGVVHPAAATLALALLALGVEVGRAAEIALRLQLLDDLLDQRVEPLLRVFGVAPVLPEQPLERLVRHHPAVEDRLQDGVVQRLPRMPRLLVVVLHAVRVVEAAPEQHVGQFRQELFEIELVEIVAGELRVAVFHRPLSCSTSSCRRSAAAPARSAGPSSAAAASPVPRR